MTESDDKNTRPQGAERRRAARIASEQEVHFSDYHALGPLRTGVVIDISSGGFRIVTRHPEPEGTLIQIEMRPDAKEGVVLFEGRVTHVSSLNGGSSAMGILKTQRPLSRAGSAAPTVPSGTIDTGIREVAASSTSSSRKTAESTKKNDTAAGTKAIFRRIGKEQNCPRERKWSKRFGFLMAIGLLGLMLLMLNRAAEDRPVLATLHGGGDAPSHPMDLETDLPREPSTSRAVETDSDGDWEETVLAAMDYALPIDGGVLAAFRALADGNPSEAASALSTLDAQPRDDPMARVQALLQYAEEADRRGETELARLAVRKALRRQNKMPSPWQSYLSSLRQSVSNSDDALPHLNDPVWLEQRPLTYAANPAVMLEVDKANYQLNVRRDGQVIRSFPVGLGRFDGTPTGQFIIANKLKSPDWYNRGNVVPAGSPDNPLGDFWLGLGDGTSATSYGLHPTTAARSIGQPMSHGCVRMRPEDAAWLFRVAPIGTPVTIR
jgi:lipoprotein-anchoring transpeptidase ErfK/SrfK